MKKYLVYVLLGAVTVLSSCLKGDDDNTPIAQPQGNFSGQFMKEHLNPTTKVRDTVKTPILLSLSSNSFQLTANEQIHAPSNGTFEYNRTLISWTDNTMTTGGNLNVAPYHLNGIYGYQYDGTNLNFEAYNDTIKYTYTLKKQ